MALGRQGSAPATLLTSFAGRSVPAGRAGAGVGTVTTIGYLGFVVTPAAVGGLAGATLPVALAAVAAVAIALGHGRGAGPRLTRRPVPPASDVSSTHVPEHHTATRPRAAGDG